MPYNKHSSNKQMFSKQPNGFTFLELLIVLIIIAIGGMFVSLIISGDKTIIPSKQSCLNAGGKWSEGIQYGRITQLCTYN
jgi:prepilin-type N-terminal cleavage/methylation domain-containing protein